MMAFKYWILGVFLFLLVPACSDVDPLSCESEADCFSNEVCRQGLCVADNVAINQNSNQHHIPQSCSFQNSGLTQCDHETDPDVIRDWGYTILPQARTYGGCGTYRDLTTFVAFDDLRSTAVACPNSRHRYGFPVRYCQNQPFEVIVQVEPLDPQCSVHELASLSLNSFPSCATHPHDNGCYHEQTLPSGGFQWTVIMPHFTMETPPSPSFNTVVFDITAHDDAHFPYEVIVNIPPLPADP